MHTFLRWLSLILQSAPELLEEDLHGQSEVELLVVQPVDCEGPSRFLIISPTQRGDGGQQGDVWGKDIHRFVIRTCWNREL